MDYQEFLASKKITNEPAGFEPGATNTLLYNFQSDITRWAIRKGRVALFEECGLGKTFQQLEWAHHVCQHTKGSVLILAPLAVAPQTVREGEKLGVNVTLCRSKEDVKPGINIANYEMLHHFDTSIFAGVVLDESSILKSYDGKTRTAIIEAFNDTPYRLACTATPAPNDHMELGNHAEFLGVLTRAEMLAMFFVHDGGETSKWRIKGHAEDDFWRWVCSWAVMLKKPSDLGYEDGNFKLPPITYYEHTISVDDKPDDRLFAVEALSLQDRQKARKNSTDERVKMCADMVNGSDDTWLIWCGLNRESEALTKAIPGAVEVKGSDSNKHKEWALNAFAMGEIRVLISKPKIAGFGMNFQVCHHTAFVGLSDSYEQFYQAVRRCWRFGQTEPVHVNIIIAETEGQVLKNIHRKDIDANRMADRMVENMHELNEKEIRGEVHTRSEYKMKTETGDNWEMRLGDCVEETGKIEDDSIHYTIYSPPFASLYTYTDSERDMGNCTGADDFADHFKFLASELYRVTMPGRLMSFHCMNLPTSKVRHGFIGIHDFRGQLIKMFQDQGFIFHSEVCIWKDPVVAMQRTKALGLLHKQLKKDSCMSRQGIPDYLVTMRKPGDNPERVEHDNESFPVQVWQNYASPIWMDINPSNTLQKKSAREHKDEKHICPLQLEVIERALRLWSNPGDTVLSPFGGIGSEGYVAIKQGRKYIGIELKESYYKVAVANLEMANSELNEGTLFNAVN